MARSPRQLTSAPYFHVINRAIDAHDLFVIEHDFRLFEGYLRDHVVGSGARLHAYALMSNHFHLLVEPAECTDLSTAIGQIQSRYAKAFNRRNDRRGTLFDRRFLAFDVSDDSEFHRVTQYIHANPIPISGRRGLASYPWSSLPVYLGRRRAPAWLSTDVLGPEIRPDRYLMSVLGVDPTEILPPAARPGIAPVGLGMVSTAVELGLESGAIRASEVHLWVALLAADLRVAAGKTVAAHLGCSESTVRRASSRCRDLVRADPARAEVFDQLRRELVLQANRRAFQFRGSADSECGKPVATP